MQQPRETALIVRYKSPRLKAMYKCRTLPLNRTINRDLHRLQFEKAIRFQVQNYDCEKDFDYFFIEIRHLHRQMKHKVYINRIFNFVDGYFAEKFELN